MVALAAVAQLRRPLLADEFRRSAFRGLELEFFHRLVRAIAGERSALHGQQRHEEQHPHLATAPGKAPGPSVHDADSGWCLRPSVTSKAPAFRGLSADLAAEVLFPLFEAAAGAAIASASRTLNIRLNRSAP